MNKSEKNKSKVSNKKQNEIKKKKRIWPYLIIPLFIAILCGIGVYIYNDSYTKKYAQEIKNIKNQNELAFKEYEGDLEYLDFWNYDDIINNLLDRNKIVSNTNISISVDDKELYKEDLLTFDRTGEFKILITLTYNYEYKIFDLKTKIIENTKEIKINVKDTIFPILTGVKDKEITVGNKIDVLAGITAKDEKEGDLAVKYNGTVDTNKEGKYTITIYAEDKNGNKTEQEMKVTVKAKKTTNPSTSSSNNNSNGNTSNGCSSASILKKRGYNSSDKNACEKDKQATIIAKQIANSILAQNYKTDIEKVAAAASAVSSYYVMENHVEKGYDYRTPYGLFVLHSASCAGCTRALIQVLENMGYTNLTHANANSWTHQWVILTMDGQVGYADGQVGWVGYGSHPVA